MVALKNIFSTGNGSDAKDFDIEKTLASLSTVSLAVPGLCAVLTHRFMCIFQTEKVALLGGKDFWHTADFPNKGIPAVRMSDGPNGVRGIK